MVPFHKCGVWLVEDVTTQAHLLWIKMLASACMASSHPGNGRGVSSAVILEREKLRYTEENQFP